MGKEPPLKFSQRGQDAREEVPMRTPKRLYAHERIIYQPALLTCPHCGDLLVMCNYLTWDKTVQMLDRTLSVASRPGRCPHATCIGSHMRLLSAEGQRHERQHRDHLAQIATQQGGLIVALDGLAPQGGEPQLWFIRELFSGLTLRSGWLCQQDQPTFEAFLAPLKHLEWPILAVLSDKQTGLVPAVATVLPNSRYQFCPAHYLRNLAEPLAEADAAFKGELRHTVRQHVGDMIRQEPRMAPGQAGVLTVTGLLPTPLEKPMAPAAQSPPLRGPLIALEAKADEVITHLVRHTRSLLTLKGRPPFRLAGLETYERLQNVAQCSLDLLAERYDPRLAQLYQGLQSALSPFAHTYQEFRQGAAWLRDIAYILEPCPTYPMSATQVAGQLRSYLDTVRRRPDVTPTFYAFGLHLDTVSRHYWPGLFHCYDVPGLPRTNALESHFRETRRRLLRITGQKGLTQRMLQRQGAWELLPGPATEAQFLDTVSQPPPAELAQERQRFAAHRQRFRLQSRSLRQTQAQCNQLRQPWSTLQPTDTG